MSDESGTGGFSVEAINISIFGKEADKALADSLRLLLRKPAEEAGSLLADWIGLTSDRINLKRKLNAELGLRAVRARLKADNVDMETIQPPKEEELHLLMNGLSLTDDDSVREMWAGLFAKALEPGSDTTAERPFLSVLDSLSPSDAKIIHFLAHATKELEALAEKEKHGGPIFLAALDPVLGEELRRRGKVIESIEEHARELGLAPPEGKNWSDNLLRQGVVEIPPAQVAYWPGPEITSVEGTELDKAFTEIGDKVREIEEAATRQNRKPETLYRVVNYAGGGADFQFQVRLSGFGRRLAEACGLL